jgi:acetyl-CoA carboxylase biotin carboxyl carrier protein
MTGPKAQPEIEELVADFQRSGMRELHVRVGDTEIYLSADPNAAGIDAPIAFLTRSETNIGVSDRASKPPTETPSATINQAPASYPSGAHIVSAPYLGTFYGAPKPGAPNYVEIGSDVTAETELCLVEVMKLFTAVRAGVAGKIHAILAKDGELVQADQPLFVIEPN